MLLSNSSVGRFQKTLSFLNANHNLPFMYKLLLFSTLVLSCPSAFAQADDLSPEERYEWRLKQSKLNDIYIPKDLNDVFSQLDQLIDEPSKAKFSSATEEIVKDKLHFSLGKWMMVNWGFYEGSRLTAYLNNIHLYHPDDMARFLMVSYHRNLNQQPLNVKAQVESLTAKREALKTDRLLEGEIIYQETRQRSLPKDSLGNGNG